MARLEKARWWRVRRVSSRKPATYRCPLCGYQLHAMSEHVLIAPEGDTSRRRHAHRECVDAAREQGRLPSRSEWERTQPRPPSLWSGCGAGCCNPRGIPDATALRRPTVELCKPSPTTLSPAPSRVGTAGPWIAADTLPGCLVAVKALIMLTTLTALAVPAMHEFTGQAMTGRVLVYGVAVFLIPAVG